MKKYAISAIASVLAAAMLTACGGGETETAENTYVEESGAAEVQEVSEETETESPEDRLDPEYNDRTAFAAFETYMRSLVKDDYYTYLAITHGSDNDEIAEEFKEKKKGYTGITLSSIEYFETDLNPLISREANYRVSEFDSDGDVIMDINTLGKGYGTVIVDKDPNTQTFYIVAHHRYSPFININ